MATEATEPTIVTAGPAPGGDGESGELVDGQISPRNKTPIPNTNRESPDSNDNHNGGNDDGGIQSLNMRADPDAQATVTDFLDFTEYLPADMMRSLTLIGQLDQTYIGASTAVNDLTSTWGKLPTLPADQRPAPVKLRAEISENLDRAVSSRVFSHAEALRMQQNVNRHYNRAKTIFAKLQAMRDNYPTAEEQVQPRSPQAVRAPKITLRLDSNGQRIQRPPRITVPGEVLAPYEVDFNAYSSSSDESSEDEISLSPPRRTTTPGTRFKIVKPPKVSKQKTPKPPKPPRAPPKTPGGSDPLSTSSALAQLKPPPDNAVAGSADAPWLQLTAYELAKLRKRMKKNAVWNPSDTMIARELRTLGRGVEAYKAAQRKAEEEGRPFNDALPAPILDSESGVRHPPEGAISAEALSTNEIQLSNRGMKLNEAKKLKREALAKMAADEAEESVRKMYEAAKQFMTNDGSPSVPGSAQDTKMTDSSQPQAQSQPQTQSQPQLQVQTPTPAAQSKPSNKAKPKKRKRDSTSETPVAEKSDSVGASQPTPKPQLKRTKTETPVPPPQLTPRPTSVPPPTETPVPVPQLGKTASQGPPVTSNTPVPVPVSVPAPASVPAPVPASTTSSDTSIVAAKPTASSSESTSPAPSSAGVVTPTATTTTTTTVPTKPPAENPKPPPPKISTTPILPPARDLPKRETRQNLQPPPASTTNVQQPPQPSSQATSPAATPAPEVPASAAAATTPATTPAPAPAPNAVTAANTTPTQVAPRRPGSRGKAASQEPPSTLAADRPRRASTARNTPAPEARQPSKRIKRPAPGVVTTNSGGTSAVGKRKAAPRKKARTTRKDKGPNAPAEQDGEVEVDDDGNVVDPNEPRYCVCNGVSFGMMISCDNVDNCKQEWFHLECVGLSDIPARTTKWYCPDCRVLLNIGGRGEVTSRGVKM